MGGQIKYYKSLQLSVIRENVVILSKVITYLEIFNTFLITPAKTPKLAIRVTFLRLSWPLGIRF